MITIDASTLANIITRCFGYSSDGRFTETQQGAFLAAGKRLRGLLLNLISAQFDNGTASVLAANTQLNVVNTNLSNAADTIAKAVDRLHDIASLVKNLDALIGIATNFV